MDSTLTAYKVALLWTILCTNRHETLTKTLTQNSSIDSHLFRRVNCQERRPPSKYKVASWNLLRSVTLGALFSCNSTQTILGRRHFGIRCIQDKFYKSKNSSHFPKFDASKAWQMGHNSWQGFFLGKNCSWTLLPGST